MESNEMLKYPVPGAKCFLLRIYSQSWLTGTAPTIRREVLMRPIQKKGKDKQDPANYHLGKLLERITHKRFSSPLQ